MPSSASTTSPACIGRLAPTPSGQLHLGNVLAFASAWLSARQQGGELLLRIEDVDRGRARPDVAAQQREDLRWLGLDWDREVPAQRSRDYLPWLSQLHERAYRCVCTRAQRQRTPPGWHPCRDAQHPQGSWRFSLAPGWVPFHDRRWGPQRVDMSLLHDPVLRRADGVFAYALAVVADDITDGVTEVVRGADLLTLTASQIQLWQALGAPPPSWLHSPLVLGPDGHKLSKSHGDTEIRALRAAGWSPSQLWRTVLPWLGLPQEHLHHAIDAFSPTGGPLGPVSAW